ncbi:MAG: ImmA/IrrE family metallo-endopeptidase [Actinobacteria bacterium]|nr:ImmA/IrrE family metallo-endopeptidase [Actinomycetota bacterium]
MSKISAARKKELDLIARERADGIRRAWGLGIEPVSDIFGLIERRQKDVIVLRYPVSSQSLSAFIAINKDGSLIFVNTNMSLGRQIFSAAHELSHLLYDKEHLHNNLLVCDPGQPLEDEREVLADKFAGALLLPEEGVRNTYYSMFGYKHKATQGTVMTLQGIFKVSYAAMLYALLRFQIITISLYDHLKEFGTIENAELLLQEAKKYGIEDLVVPTRDKVIPGSLLPALTSNYTEGRISYKKLSSILALWDKVPEEMGFTYEEFI